MRRFVLHELLLFVSFCQDDNWKANNNKEDTGTSKVGKKMSGTVVEPLFPVLGKLNVMKSILEKWGEGCH